MHNDLEVMIVCGHVVLKRVFKQISLIIIIIIIATTINVIVIIITTTTACFPVTSWFDSALVQLSALIARVCSLFQHFFLYIL